MLRRWLPGLVLLTACESSRNVDFFQEVTADPAFPGTPGDPASYDAVFAYTPDPHCVPDVPRRLDRRTEVRIFTGNGVSAGEVNRYAGGLQRYYDFYGVTMFTRHEVIAVPMDHAITLNEHAIADQMRTEGIDPACLDLQGASPACARAYGAALFYNVKQFLHAYAEPDDNVVNLVLLKRVASLDPGSDSALLNWGIAGLGLSQDLLTSAAGSDLGASLIDILDESNFAPTVFIAVNLTDFVLREPDVVVAHEFGHAYSLEHVDPTYYGPNLMNPTATTCDLSLDSDQLTTIEQQTARYGDVVAPSDLAGPAQLSFAHRAPAILQLVRARVAALADATGGTP